MREEFLELQKLKRQRKITFEAGRGDSISNFGGQLGLYLFMAIFAVFAVKIVLSFLNGLFISGALTLVAFLLVLKLWNKLAFYYLCFRAGKDYHFFCSVYAARIIRLRVANTAITVSHPKPWDDIFVALRTAQGRNLGMV
ncbi:MAG: hypothetical protein JW844_05210 [Candidatus Omnitrophica bacterium]|nr:hypothetical protein [Candidatus Omnitrophota bacterium]